MATSKYDQNALHGGVAAVRTLPYILESEMKKKIKEKFLLE